MRTRATSGELPGVDSRAAVSASADRGGVPGNWLTRGAGDIGLARYLAPSRDYGEPRQPLNDRAPPEQPKAA